MDGFQSKVASDGAIASPSLYAVAGADRALEADGMSLRRIESLDSIVVTKTAAGFDAARVEALRGVVREARLGRLGRLKFIVFDFAHAGEAEEGAAEGFDALVAEVANLILEAPIVSVACARGRLAGADLEFALGCSMLIGDAEASFSFAVDPIAAINLYGFLAQKIGFVRAERLMESGEVLDAQQMQELLLLKEIVSGDADGVAAFLRRAVRRHNASYGIYRAQRIASPPVRMRQAVA